MLPTNLLLSGANSLVNAGTNYLKGLFGGNQQQQQTPTSAAATGNPFPTPKPIGNQYKDWLKTGGPQKSGMSDIDKLEAEIKALTDQITGMGQVYAPQLDYKGINAKARKAAEGAINPLYQRKLTEFIEEQNVLKARKKSEYQTGVKNLEDSLAQALEGSELSRTRTSEDVATNLGQIDTAEDIMQTDTGDAFATERQGLSEQVFGSGLGTSGLGRQQVAGQQTARNTEEQRAADQFDFNRRTQEVFKARTFEDLAKSDELANLSTVKGKAKAKFDLDNYLEDIEFQTRAQKQLFETDRLQDILAATSNEKGKLVEQFIQGISDPGQRQAAYSAYGGYL